MAERPPIVGAIVGGAAAAAEGFLRAGDQDGQFEAGDPAAIYTDYEVRSHYEKDRHTYMMGTTTPEESESQPGSVAFAQLARPTLLWIADWTAARQKEKPDIPDPRLIMAIGLGHRGLLTTTVNSDWVLLDDHYTTANYTLLADGTTPVFRISGIYVYGHRRPSDLTIEQVSFPRRPDFKNFVQRRVQTTSLNRTIIN